MKNIHTANGIDELKLSLKLDTVVCCCGYLSEKAREREREIREQRTSKNREATVEEILVSEIALHISS